MQAQHDDPPVSLDDISQVQCQLFRRWLPAFTSAGLKMIAIWILGTTGVYFISRYLKMEWALAPAHVVAAVSMAIVVLLPFLMWVLQSLWLDLRISRRLDSMSRRVRAGEIVRASEVRL